MDDSYLDELMGQSIKDDRDIVTTMAATAKLPKKQKTAPLNTKKQNVDLTSDMITTDDLFTVDTTQSTRPVSPLPSNTIALQGIEHTLSERGLVPTGKVLIDGKPKYIKALSRYGQMLLIIIDTPESITSTAEDQEYDVCDQSHYLADSYTKGLLECIGININGLAFVSPEARVILIRQWDRNGDIEPTNLQIPGTNVSDASVYFTYPMVLYSSILIHPKIVSKNCMVAYARCNTILNTTSNEQHKLMQKHIKDLENNYEKYNKSFTSTTAAVDAYVASLVDINNQYGDEPWVGSEDNIRRFRLVQLNTYRRMEMIDELTVLRTNVNNRSHEIAAMANELVAVTERINAICATASDTLFDT